MKATDRRKTIIQILTNTHTPISATTIANQLKVSRQIIVGDVALLRAAGYEINATPKGYLLNENTSSDTRFIGKIACQHAPEDTTKELYLIVDHGGEIVDVIIEHPIYGELLGRLNLTSRYDVDEFMEKVTESHVELLSSLTEGVHLHTIACKDKNTFKQIKKSLTEAGFCYQN